MKRRTSRSTALFFVIVAVITICALTVPLGAETPVPSDAGPLVPGPAENFRQDAQGRRTYGPPVAQRGADPSTPHSENPASPSATSSESQQTAAVPANWLPLGPFGGDIEVVAVSPMDSNIVLAGLAPNSGTGGTMYRSTDGAGSWSEVSDLSGTSVYDIEFLSDGTALAGLDGDVWKSTDDGSSWTPLNLGLGEYDSVREVAIDRSNENRIWAGMGGTTSNLMRSTNGGTSWDDVTPPAISDMTCRGVAFHPTDTSRVYAAFGGWLGGSAFYVSENYGAGWISRSAGLPNYPFEDVVHDGSRLLLTGGQLFGSQDVGLYSSANDGVNWTALHDASWPVMALTDIALDPNDTDVIYLASLGAGAYRSDDGGDSWQFNAEGVGGLSLKAVNFAPGSSSTIYLGASSIGVLKSTNSGSTFNTASVGIGALTLYSVAANPNDSEELAIAFQAQNSGGVYSTIDGGQSWTLEPVPGTRWSDVRFHPNGTLHAISSGPSTIADEGLYRRNAGGSWTGLGPDQGTAYESDLVETCFSINDASLILLGGADFGNAGFEATIWRSANGGSSWDKAYEGPVNYEDVTAIRIIEDGTDSTMVASFTDLGPTPQTGGALRSTNGGQVWTESSTGLDVDVHGAALAASPDDSQTFYYADGFWDGGSLYKTLNGGTSWSATGYTGQVTGVVCDPSSDQIVYIMQPDGDQVLVSTDGGAVFTPINQGLAAVGSLRDLALADGVDPSLLLATSTGAYRYSLAPTVPYIVAGAGPGYDNPPLVGVHPPEQDAAAVFEFSAYGAPHYGVNVSSGFFGGSDHAVVLTGAGPGRIYGPHVRAFQVDGTPIPGISFLAYGTNKYGVNVAAGDIDGDDLDEIITGAGPGAVFGPHVRAFDYDGSPPVTPVPGVSYFAYGTLRWGVNVAAGDIDGDGMDEILTGAGPGTVFGPHVRGWNVDGGPASSIPAVSFLAYGTNRYGVVVSSGDVDGDGIDEIVTAPGPSPAFGAQVRGWNYDGASLTAMDGINFFAWTPSQARYGARVYAGADLDGDGRDDMVVGAGPDPSVASPIKVYRFLGGQAGEWISLDAFSSQYMYGSSVAALEY